MGHPSEWKASLQPYVQTLRSQLHLTTSTPDGNGGMIDLVLPNGEFGKPVKPVLIMAETWFNARTQACALLQAEPFEVVVVPVVTSAVEPLP